MCLVPLTDEDRAAFRAITGFNLPCWYPGREAVAEAWKGEVRRKSERYRIRKRRSQANATAKPL